MNIQSYAMPGAAYFFPVAYGDLTGFNLDKLQNLHEDQRELVSVLSRQLAKWLGDDTAE